MVTSGEPSYRAAIGASSNEGLCLNRRPLGIHWTGPEVASRLSQLALDTDLLAACASAIGIRCLTAPAKVVSALPGLVLR